MTETPRILVVDDDQSLLRLLDIRLTAAGYVVEAVLSGEQALARLGTFRPQLVITDLRMEGMDGMALFEALHQRHPSLPVIILTAHGTIPDAVEATSRGVFGYLTKPFDSYRLLADVERALRCGGGLPDTAQADKDWCSEIVTRSSVMEELLQQVRLAAGSEAAILIQSESGTGKELLARAVHRASRRSEQAFLALNCAAIPEALLESELFGHEKGSFTGATRSQPGLFQAANGGTLFLDEIGDMPLSFQAKLLRVLQDGQVRPVGATRAVSVDVRIISATHRDLEAAVGEGEFREDLFYRLNVIMLELPPLRERREDIPLLAAHFLAEARSREDGALTARSFSPEAMERLVAAPWPGNVRQLVNVVEQCAVLSTTAVIPVSLVERALRGQAGRLLPLVKARDQFERDYLVQILQITEGNVAQASRLAGRNRTEFYKLLRRHHLDPDLFRSG
jgi:two-component system response regulator GlrR